MSSNLEKYKKDLEELIKDANSLQLSLLLEINPKKKEKYKDIKPLDFHQNYEKWYSEALHVIKQILPDRTDDFIKLYKAGKRKEINVLTYTISDYLLGITITRGEEVMVDGKAAQPKFQQQIAILGAAKRRFESSLFDIKHIVQADLFDSELDAARELAKKGFLRGAGAIAGVVLEKHLAQVCDNHKIKITKKHPAISDYNDKLKKDEVIETPTWRFIQHIGDLRNLCDHNKKQEPKKDDVNELITGVDKTIKTLF